MLSGSLALLLSALFAGAALYVSFVEHPARATLDDRAALGEWQPSYKRGAVMQASLAVFAFLAGLVAERQLDFRPGGAVADSALALDLAGDPADQPGVAENGPRTGRAAKPGSAGTMGPAARHAHHPGMCRGPGLSGGMFDFTRL